MGREIKRVPIDFDWPLNERWSGFLSPDEFHFPTCSACAGDGYGREAKAIANTFYAHMIGGPYADALAWCDKLGQAEVDNLVSRGRLMHNSHVAAEVNDAQRRGGFGPHDAINRMILVEFRCNQLGIVVECPTCNGMGDMATNEQRAEADAWEREEPPAGEGWQLWETVSEGSPISPVFDTPEGLAGWMSSPAYRWGAQGPWPYDDALRWITGAAWMPSFMVTVPHGA